MMTDTTTVHPSIFDLSWEKVPPSTVAAWIDENEYTYADAAEDMDVTMGAISGWKRDGINASAYPAIWHIRHDEGCIIESRGCTWDRLKSLMDICGLTVANLAVELNTCASTVRNWRNAGEVSARQGYARLCAWLCDEMGVVS